MELGKGGRETLANIIFPYLHTDGDMVKIIKCYVIALKKDYRKTRRPYAQWLPQAQCSWDELQIHHNPDKINSNKELLYNKYNYNKHLDWISWFIHIMTRGVN